MDDVRFWLVVIAIVSAIVAVARWTGKVDTRLENLEKAVKTVADDIKKILRLWQPEVAGASPLKLTELGDRMALFMKAHNWAGGIAPDLLPKVSGMQPFEIDRFARNYVAEELDPETERLVDVCAYEFGRESTGVRNVLHVVLRDKLIHLLRDNAN